MHRQAAAALLPIRTWVAAVMERVEEGCRQAEAGREGRR